MIAQSRSEVKNSGVFIGVVKDNMDPEKLGRLKVLVPGYNDNTALDDLQWVSAAFPFGGYKDQGFFFIPAVGAEVVVMFPNGGETPIWIGCINKKGTNPGPREATQEADDDHYYQRKQIKTQIGWILFDDKEGYMSLNHNNGSFIAMDKDGNIDIRAYKNLNIKAGKNVTISAENGSVSLEASDSLKAEAHDGDLTISADKKKILLTTLVDDLHIVSGKNIEMVAKEDIKEYAEKNVYRTAAKESIYDRAKKNIEVYATEQFKTHSEKDTLIGAKEDLTVSSSKDIYQYAEKNYYSTAGETGKICYGKSTDLVVSEGEFTISSLAGELKINAKEDLILDSQQRASMYGKTGIAMNSDQNIMMVSKQNTDIEVMQTMNVNVLNNLNLNGLNDVILSARMGLYLSSADLVDIYGAFRIYEHSPMLVTHESGVSHLIKDNVKIDKANTSTIKTSSAVDISSGTHIIRAGMLRLC